MQVHITVMGNYTALSLPGALISLHDFVPVPPVPVFPPFVPTIEAPVPVMWPPGFALQQNKLTTTVFHKFQFIMLEGHDCGYMIPHVSIPVNNAKLPLIIAFSSRKVMFSASKVKANGTAIGCSQLLMIPLPMMTCMNPISVPTSTPFANFVNTVIVGMTPGDIWAGVIAIGLSMVGDALCAFVFKADMFEAFGPVLGGLMGNLLGFSNPAQFLVKAGLGALAGGAKIWLTGEGSISVGVGSGYGQVQVGYTRTAEGGNQIGISGQAGAPMGSISGNASHTWNADGTTGSQRSATVATPVASHTESTSTESDASGTTTKTTESSSEQGGLATPAGSVAGSHQESTTTTPQGSTTTESGAGGVSTPLGGGTRGFGRTL